MQSHSILASYNISLYEAYEKVVGILVMPW